MNFFRLINSIYTKTILSFFLSIYFKKNFFKNNIYFANNPFISKKNKIDIKGNNIYIGHNCHLGANVKFNSYIMLGSNVSFVGGDHNYKNIGSYMFFSGRDELKSIIIEDDVWIGHGSIILQNITIGKGSIVAAGSVLTKDVEPYSIVGGNPAKLIKRRFTLSEIEMHENQLIRNNKI